MPRVACESRMSCVHSACIAHDAGHGARATHHAARLSHMRCTTHAKDAESASTVHADSTAASARANVRGAETDADGHMCCTKSARWPFSAVARHSTRQHLRSCRLVGRADPTKPTERAPRLRLISANCALYTRQRIVHRHTLHLPEARRPNKRLPIMHTRPNSPPDSEKSPTAHHRATGMG